MTTKYTHTIALLSLLVCLALAADLRAAIIYIGDNAAAGQSPTDLGGPDSANSGNLTYAFPTIATTNGSGDTQTFEPKEVNFWSDASSGTLTPFLALYSGPAGSASSSTCLTGFSLSCPVFVSLMASRISFSEKGASISVIFGFLLMKLSPATSSTI